MLIDTHCHLYYDNLFENLDQVLGRARDQGVTKFICVGTNLSDSKKSLTISNKYEGVFASVGIHPHDSKDAPDNFVEEIYDLMKHKNIVALGEMGLDYFRNLSEPKIQKRVFRAQLGIAKTLNKPVILHNRDADNDLLKILSEYPDVKGIAHCFSSTLEVAERLVSLGYFISFSGNITYKNSHLPQVARKVPLNRLLIETDCPFLSPHPHRGKTNEPSRVRLVAEKLAEIHSMPLKRMTKITSKKCRKNIWTIIVMALKSREHPFRKKWGQNFLIDKNLLEKIARTISPEYSDCFLEIGPGDGSLTELIYPYTSSMIAVEIDPLLVNNLKSKPILNGLDIMHGDILSINIEI